ncbi:MAG: RNA polymerase factor sigma-54 [Firmicutes bacterium]|nr:RNA polymerase factor sigma-54 [Bacillota bacterium]
MELNFRNELKTEQTQKLALSQEMVQSLNILKFSGEELLDYLSDAMDENPVIDVELPAMEERQIVEVTDDSEFSLDENSDFIPEEDLFGSVYDGVYDAREDDWEPHDWYEYSETVSNEYDSYYGRFTYDSEYRDLYDYDLSGNGDISLSDHLAYQLEMTDAPFMTKAVADYIILSLDENGYMKVPLKEVAEELNVEESLVEDALQLVTTFDPVGVGARTLGECMILQLQSIGRMDDMYRTIIENHLENIAFNRLGAIAKDTGLSLLEVQDRADTIRSLEPKPGRAYSVRQDIRYIIPDVKVEKDQDEYNVSINRVASPKVIIRSEYRDMLRDSENGSAVADFLTSRFNTAKWLIRSIDQRNETILKVTGEIVRRQKAFFDEGKQALRPLTMREVAESVGVHESTVSRAVNGKYLQCQQGVYELRYFFTGAADAAGDATSEYLKQIIANLVQAEDQRLPMSDRSIAEAILIMGIKISRRTVAKYREEMGIPSSTLRKRI